MSKQVRIFNDTGIDLKLCGYPVVDKIQVVAATTLDLSPADSHELGKIWRFDASIAAAAINHEIVTEQNAPPETEASIATDAADSEVFFHVHVFRLGFMKLISLRTRLSAGYEWHYASMHVKMMYFCAYKLSLLGYAYLYFTISFYSII